MRGAHEPLRLVVEARPARSTRAAARRPAGANGAVQPDALGEQVGRVRVVAAEELVAALARERDLHVLRGELRDEVRRQRRGVGERLVERVGQSRQEQRRVRPEHELAVLRPVALRDEPRVGELVEAALLEADRERAQRLRAPPRRRARRARHESTPPERSTPTGTSDYEMRAHRVAQPRAQLLDELGLVVVANLVRRNRRRPRVARELAPRRSPTSGRARAAACACSRKIDQRRRERS